MSHTSYSTRLGHSHIPYFEAQATRSGAVLWINLHGEVDLGNRRELEDSLVGVDLQGVTDVHLDMSNLEFCDIDCVRRLVAFALQVNLVAGDVTTHHAKPIVQKVARLLGADAALRFSSVTSG